MPHRRMLLLWLAAFGVSVFLYLERSAPDPEPLRAEPVGGLPSASARADAGMAPAARLDAGAADAAVAADAGLPLPSVQVFRMDFRRSGRSPHSGPSRPALAWRFGTQGPVRAQPVVGPDGSIYVGSLDGYFYALHPDGRLRWKKNLRDRVYGAALVGREGHVYVGADGGVLWSFTAGGRVRWRLETRGDVDTAPIQATHGGIYVAAGRSLLAVRPDGVLRWRFEASEKIYSSPAVGRDSRVYVGSQDDHLYALAADGRVAWSFATRGDNDATPAIGADGTIYFGSDDGHVYALRPDGERRWMTRVGAYVRGPAGLGEDGALRVGIYGPRPALLALDLETGAERWRVPVTMADSAEIGIAAGPLVDARGWSYFGAHDDMLYAVDARGRLRWTFATQGDVDASATLTPDGRLLFGSDDGFVYAVDTAAQP